MDAAVHSNLNLSQGLHLLHYDALPEKYNPHSNKKKTISIPHDMRHMPASSSQSGCIAVLILKGTYSGVKPLTKTKNAVKVSYVRTPAWLSGCNAFWSMNLENSMQTRYEN